MISSSPRVYLLLLASYELVLRGDSCLSGPLRSSFQGRSGKVSNREAFVFGQFVPNRSEMSIVASGLPNGRISKDSLRFKELVENHNTEIVFKDEEQNGEDHIMTQSCKDKLDSLSIMVMNQWPGVKLRVIEAWDQSIIHSEDSLHYEGRAVDITTSDRDRRKLPLLARLAYDAGFHYVSYVSRSYIHCSVRSEDNYQSTGSGCFSANTTVSMADGSIRPLIDLKVNDRVKAIAPETGEIMTDKVYMFLDRQVDSTQSFVVIDIEGHSRQLELTSHHLIYAVVDDNVEFQDVEPIFAQELTESHYIFIHSNGKLHRQKVSSINHVVKKGFLAPVTFSGNIVVDGVVCSCYALVDHQLAHTAMAPARWFHEIYYLLANESHFYVDGVHWYGGMLSSIFFFLLPANS